VTLVAGESRYVMSASPGDAEMLIALDVYPERVSDLLDVERIDDVGQLERFRETRDVLVVHPTAIMKVELLDEHPGERGEFGMCSGTGGGRRHPCHARVD